jgi:hypothetical protein
MSYESKYLTLVFSGLFKIVEVSLSDKHTSLSQKVGTYKSLEFYKYHLL